MACLKQPEPSAFSFPANWNALHTNAACVIRLMRMKEPSLVVIKLCHTSAETARFLEGQKIELTGHPPYSPDLADLAPNDFYWFPSVNNNVRSQHLSSREEAVDAFKMNILGIPQSEWKKCY
ncbi:hypothetical protein EVAR_74909_1 [Eumeta japonica]|uniref:Mariner Mos1 transposase n=1 Tax=Eumeta variegata TaxID=151549 RepID=A0A4C1UJ78_EUMVA|nr:hypothetical protein EVAR_74909_1 [Eumeta japonica]